MTVIPKVFPPFFILATALLVLAAAIGSTTSALAFPTRQPSLLSRRRSFPSFELYGRTGAGPPLERTTTTTTTTIASSMSPSLAWALSIPRAGGLSSAISSASANPVVLFDSTLLVLGISAILLKTSDRFTTKKDAAPPSSTLAADKKGETKKPQQVQSLQIKFLLAFWLLRCGYWMSGPYVVPAYKSKVFYSTPASMGLVSKIFLTGFAATAIFGPSIGEATDKYGRKRGTIMYAILYSLGCLSILSNTRWVLFAGRAIIGCALGLLFTAPEAWLNGEASRTGLTKYLGETFGLAYTGDALVAIVAGKLASWAASVSSISSGPFVLSSAFVLAGGVFAGLTWKENKAVDNAEKLQGTKKSSSLKEALIIVRQDKRLMLVGAVQSLFEAAMYVFILQWPSAVSEAIGSAFGAGATTPFGTIFSCFMTCSLIGSLLFGKSLQNNRRMTETTVTGMLGVSAVSMAAAAACSAAETKSISALLAAFFVYEACVGMYFPAIGTIRSKLIPDDRKSVILSLFGVPLNTLVVLIYLGTGKLLGMTGSFGISAGALTVATGCMLRLRSIAKMDSSA